MIKIDEAASMLGYGEHPSDYEKSEARAVLKVFGIKWIELEQQPGTFGKPSKVYNQVAVSKVAEIIKEFKATSAFWV